MDRVIARLEGALYCMLYVNVQFEACCGIQD
jgi:hypothetical protein